MLIEGFLIKLKHSFLVFRTDRYSGKGGIEVSDSGKIKVSPVKMFILLILLIAAQPILGGCLKDSSVQLHSGTSHDVPNEKESTETSSTERKIFPVNPEKGEFNRAAGWVTNDTILYITEAADGSRLFTYQLSTGADKLIFKSEFPVVKAEVNSLRKQILIHSARSTHEAELTIIDYDGKILADQRIDSYELSFEWNKEEDGEVLVTAFNEDWSYKTYLLKINENSLSKLDLPQPFAVWKSSEEILFLNWDQDSPDLQAPLIEKNLSNQKQRELLSSVHHIDSSKKVIMAVSTNQENKEFAVYRFMTKDLETISSLKVFQLTTYSGWLTPYYDIMDSQGSFIYFRPVTSGEADLYGEEFTLSRFSFKEGKEVDLVTGLANEPLSCSVQGELCLYGHQFEKVIDLREKKIHSLVKSQEQLKGEK